MSRQHFTMLLLGFVLLITSGCGPERLGLGRGGEREPTPTVAAVPTFTPSPVPASTAVPSPVAPAEPVATEGVASPSTETATPTAPDTDGSTAVDVQAGVDGPPVSAMLPTVTPPSAAANAVPATDPLAVVTTDAANVRNGPGTEYEVIGVALRDAQYPLAGRNAQGDWWQVCCFGGQPGWLYAALVTTQNTDTVAIVIDVPPPIIPAPAEPVALAPPVEDPAPQEQPLPPQQEAQPEAPPAEEPAPVQHSGTAGSFDPNAQYQIVHYRVLGFDDNNGGIFNKGGQHFIFLTVLDQNGAPLDGVVVKDAVGDKLNVVTGSKGPGTAEITMDWDPYKLYVAADPGGAVTSQVSNQMNTAYPHIADVTGMLGPPDNEYAICPTPDDRCTPPFYHAHWSYEITFQKVR